MTRLEALKALVDKVEAGSLTYDYCIVQHVHGVGMNASMWDAYQGSLDAAKSLHEAVLPGWSWQGFGGELWRVWQKSDPEFNFVGLEHDTPARAWMLAIIKALIAREVSQ